MGTGSGLGPCSPKNISVGVSIGMGTEVST